LLESSKKGTTRETQIEARMQKMQAAKKEEEKIMASAETDIKKKHEKSCSDVNRSGSATAEGNLGKKRRHQTLKTPTSCREGAWEGTSLGEALTKVKR